MGNAVKRFLPRNRTYLVPRLCLGTHCNGGSASAQQAEPARQRVPRRSLGTRVLLQRCPNGSKLRREKGVGNNCAKYRKDRSRSRPLFPRCPCVRGISAFGSSTCCRVPLGLNGTWTQQLPMVVEHSARRRDIRPYGTYTPAPTLNARPKTRRKRHAPNRLS